jgi:ubiquinone biosynthesis protein
MIKEFEKTIKDELDFTKEGENADAFRHNFSRYQGIRVPKVKWIYTTKRVLTMEYIEGIKVSDVKALEEAGIDGKRVAERLAICICNQIFRDGFFHADPHPGNIQVMPDGTIVFLDLGMVGRLNEFQKAIISKFLIGVVFRDSHLVVKSLVDMKAVTSQSRVRDFKKDIDDLIGKYLTMPMNEIKIEEVFREVFRIAFLNRVKIPREFTLLAKTLGTLQGLLEKLAPDLNALVIAEPIAKKLFYQSFFDRKIYGKMRKSLLNYRELLSEFPAALQNIVDKIADEDFAVQFEMKDMDRLQRQLERLFNRVSFSIILLAVSIIIAGVLISSGLSAGTSGEMHIFNITVLKAGLALAAVIVVGLVISMIRSRH